MDNSQDKERQAYIYHVEQKAEDLFKQLENSNEQKQDELIDGFIQNLEPESEAEYNTDEEIKRLWRDLRKKMIEKSKKKNLATTKRYVKEYIHDIKPKTKKTSKREISSKIKLTKEEEDQLKLFGQL